MVRFTLPSVRTLVLHPTPVALPAPDVENTVPLGEKQTDLNGFVKSTPKWSKEGLLEHIFEFIIMDDQVFIL